MKILLVVLSLITSYALMGKSHRQSIVIPNWNQKSGESQLELIQFLPRNKSAHFDYVFLFLPGYFQNGESFDLLPHKGISVVRYLQKIIPNHSYLLNPNGIGRSTYIKHSNIDDMAIYDLENSLQFLKRNYPHKKIVLFSHSMGAFVTKAYLGGIRHCEESYNCFDSNLAELRQKQLHLAVFSAGNSCITNDRPKNVIRTLVTAATPIIPFTPHLGFLSTKVFNKLLFPIKKENKKNIITHNKFWKFLYNPKNVSTPARNAIYSKTVEGTSAPTILQLYQGFKLGCLHTKGKYESYQKGLANIRMPIFQMLYGKDGLSPIHETIRDDYSYISTPQMYKGLKLYLNQGHEDYMMSAKYDKNLLPIKAFLDRLK